jgi:metallo-beta-lactamase family protein
MKLTFHGGAREVTGSMHLLEANGQRILLECGLFQGHREEANRRNREFAFDPKTIDTVVLSHAHTDHAGNLPGLVGRGFRGPIYSTSATRDLCAVMLPDSAHIQQQDAEFFNRRIRKNSMAPIEPLYTSRDALAALEHFVTANYEMKLPIGDGVVLQFRDAGHVLGSASVVLEITEQGVTKRLIFSGDVGRAETPLLRDPVPAWDADVLIMESTYGDRVHEPYASATGLLADTIRRTAERGGKVIVPSFALERAQEVIYALRVLLHEGRIPEIPVFVDSPLTSDITQVFRIHPECFDEEITNLYVKNDSPFYFPGLTYVRRVEESKALNERRDPMIIISANGMCEAGRILHHLSNNIEDPRNTILFVGYQAEHTLGRRILEGAPEVPIFGRLQPRRAEVVTLSAMSGHADRTGLLAFAEPSKHSCKELVLVHGEPEQSEPLAARLRDAGYRSVRVAERGQTLAY